ncbi:MAG: carbohydrate ABC transporter permease [Flexilinea sp.]
MVTLKNKSNTLGKRLTPYLYLSPTILLMIILMLVPIVIVIGYSFFDNVIMNKNPIFVGIENYIEILKDKNFHQTVLNTIFFTVSSVIFHMLIGLTFATLLNTKLLHNTTKSIFRVIYILPWVFTAAIIAILWRLMLNPNGIINYILEMAGLISSKVEWLGSRDTALFALTFINIWSGYPFYMVSLLAGLQGISVDLYEAANVDGANAVQKFIYITIPQLKPIIVSMAMLDCIWTMQQFPLVWMTTGGGPIRATEMLSTYTYKLAFSKYQFSLASASAVIILVFSMLLAFVYVKKQKARD